MLERVESSLTEDVVPLLPVGVTFSDAEAIKTPDRIWHDFVPRLQGEPWKLSAGFIKAVQAERYPGFLRKEPRPKRAKFPLH